MQYPIPFEVHIDRIKKDIFGIAPKRHSLGAFQVFLDTLGIIYYYCYYVFDRF